VVIPSKRANSRDGELSSATCCLLLHPVHSFCLSFRSLLLSLCSEVSLGSDVHGNRVVTPSCEAPSLQASEVSTGADSSGLACLLVPPTSPSPTARFLIAGMSSTSDRLLVPP
jgi:hypothetical protein